MIPQYLEPLVHHLWQSTLFAAVIGAATLAMSKNRATVRHKLWLAASLKFLIPFSLFVSFGNQFEWRTIPAAPETSGLVVAAEWLTAESPLPTSSVSESRLPAILSGLWLCGFAACVLPWLLRSRRIRATLRQASPLPLELPIKAVSYPGRLVPGVFGILKPVLLLPEGITDRLTREQLHSVLTHELCHVRRRDNLWSMVHLLVESLFWFHPLVWWLETKLVEEQ